MVSRESLPFFLPDHVEGLLCTSCAPIRRTLPNVECFTFMPAPSSRRTPECYSDRKPEAKCCLRCESWLAMGWRGAYANLRTAGGDTRIRRRGAARTAAGLSHRPGRELRPEAHAAAALSPLLSDGLIVVVTVPVLSRLSGYFAQWLRLAGSIFVLYLARGTFRTWSAWERGLRRKHQHSPPPRVLSHALSQGLWRTYLAPTDGD